MKTATDPSHPHAIAARYEGQGYTESAESLRTAARTLRYRSLHGRGFQWDAIALADGVEPRDAWQEIQAAIPEAYDRPAVYHGAMGPCAI